MNANMQEKALKVLVCARLMSDSRALGNEMHEALVASMGRKVVARKRGLLHRRGYIEIDGTITAKGRRTLVNHHLRLVDADIRRAQEAS